MPLANTDLVVRYSVAAAAGDTTAGTAPTSLGDQVSTTAIATGANAWFDDVSAAESSAGDVEYRCGFVLNNHATITAFNVVVFISAEVASGAVIALASDNIAASAKGAGTTQAATIATEDTAPTGVGTFSSPTTQATGIALGTLTPGQVRGFWIRRTVAAATASIDNDGFTLGVGAE